MLDTNNSLGKCTSLPEPITRIYLGNLQKSFHIISLVIWVGNMMLYKVGFLLAEFECVQQNKTHSSRLE